MRKSLPVFLLLISSTLMAQRDFVQAKVLDVDKQQMIGAHVSNVSSGKVTVTNQYGAFQIPAMPGDTLLMTSIGFQSLMVEVTAEWGDQEVQLFMQEGLVELGEVSVYSIPPIEQFKEQIMEIKPKDSAFFWYYGVDKPVIRGDKMAEGNVHKKLLYAVLQPANFLYYNLSKAEKEKRKFHQVQRQSTAVNKAGLKFTRDWVSEHTGYVYEELTSFIAFCDYSPFYLSKTPLYLIMEDMLNKKIAFEKSMIVEERP